MRKKSVVWHTIRRTVLILTLVSLPLAIIVSCITISQYLPKSTQNPPASTPTTASSTTPGQATPTATPTPPITPTTISGTAHNTQLSEAMLLDSNCQINFMDPYQDVVVNGKLLQANFSSCAGRFSFKLDTQKSLQLECGLGNNEPQGDTYELKVLGDNRELLSQIYVAGQNAVTDQVNIQGVQILTLELTGTYGNPAFYCQDQLIY